MAIITNYKIEDEDVKKLLVSNILLDKLLNEMSNNLTRIINYSIYPPSTYEEEREIIDEEFFL